MDAKFLRVKHGVWKTIITALSSIAMLTLIGEHLKTGTLRQYKRN